MSLCVIDLIVFSAALGASVVLTALLRRYALACCLVDVPNKRSSHRVPTPRGGGVAIVLTFLSGLPVLAWAGRLEFPVMVALFGAGVLVAMVGFLDDLGHIAACWRLLAHFISAFWILAWMGGVPGLPFFGHSLSLGWLGLILMTLYLVWLLNLYNFMDGIDGIASVEAMTVSFGGSLLYWLATPDVTAWVVPVLLLAAVCGFLVWNFPPAKIFMGDAGSGFLGLTLGALSIHAAWTAPTFFWSWVILLGVFVVDATVTLLRRVYRGEKFYVAHRSHAYQYASRKLGAHKPVTLVVGLINIVWLLPLALFVGLGVLEGVVGLCVAYAPLVWLAFRFKAGARELRTEGSVLS
jgi:Fuc2NAc and GlcNAc transferase